MARASTSGKKPADRGRTSGRSTPAAAPRAAEVSAKEAQRIARGLTPQAAPRDGRERPSERRLYFARRPLGYRGQQFDREQQLQLVGLVNDAKLVDLKYLAPWPEGQPGFPCRHCPSRFLSLSALNAHGDRRHAPPKPVPEMEPRQADETEREFEERRDAFLASVQAQEDAELEAEERRLNQIAPLDLTQTTASRMG